MDIMRKRVSPEKVKADCGRVLKVWKKNQSLSFGDELTYKGVGDDCDKLTTLISDIDQKEIELETLRKARTDLARLLCEKASRVKSGIRAVFGPDSSEFELAGGVRSSERKKRVRKNDAGAKVK